jgi:hypothetical protein
LVLAPIFVLKVLQIHQVFLLIQEESHSCYLDHQSHRCIDHRARLLYDSGEVESSLRFLSIYLWIHHILHTFLKCHLDTLIQSRKWNLLSCNQICGEGEPTDAHFES